MSSDVGTLQSGDRHTQSLTGLTSTRDTWSVGIRERDEDYLRPTQGRVRGVGPVQQSEVPQNERTVIGVSRPSFPDTG